MNTQTSNQLCSNALQQSTIKSIHKKKKINLTNELLGGIIQFKRMITSRRKEHNMSFLDPVECDNLKLDYNAAKDASTVGVKTLQEVILNEKSYSRDYVSKLTKYLNELHQLNCAKEDHIKNLENFLDEEDNIIASLRMDIEKAFNAYETQRRRFHQYHLDALGHSVLLKIIEKFKFVCEDILKIDLEGTENDAIKSTIKESVESLRSDIFSVVSDINKMEFSQYNELSKTETIKIAIKQLDRMNVAKLADIPPESLITIVNLLDNETLQINNFLALWYVIKTMYENNQILENTAKILEYEMETLQTNLSDVTSEYMELSANKCDKQCESVVLDDFCAVTEEITAQQIRNLEFGRIFAIDDKRIADDLNKIEQLKSKITRKQNKKHKLLKETVSVQDQLEMYKNQLEELEKRNSILTGDLICMKRSPSNQGDPSETQGFGPRAKHLKQLKIQHNKLTNKREALKIKLQKYQQEVKTPSRMNQFLKP